MPFAYNGFLLYLWCSKCCFIRIYSVKEHGVLHIKVKIYFQYLRIQ